MSDPRPGGMNPDRDHLIALIEALRADMLNRLDTLAAAVQDSAPAAPPARAAAPPRRPRSPYRGQTVPTDLDRAKARAALKRMRLS